MIFSQNIFFSVDEALRNLSYTISFMRNMRKYDKEIIDKMRELRKKGFSIRKIGEILSIPRSTVYLYIKEYDNKVENKIRELERTGLDVYDISEILEMPIRTIHYYMAREKREKRVSGREGYHKKAHYDAEFREFLGFIDGELPYRPSHNIYLDILKELYSSKNGLTCRGLEKRIDKLRYNISTARLIGKVKRMMNLGIVEHRKKRYAISEKYFNLCKELFNKSF